MKLSVIHNESFKEGKVIKGEFGTSFSPLVWSDLFDVCMVAYIVNRIHILIPMSGVWLVPHHILGCIWNGGRWV